MNFDSEKIKVLTKRNSIIERPNLYLGRPLDKNSLYWLINSIIEDTINSEKFNSASIVTIDLLPDSSIKITDNGRGLPLEPHFAWIHGPYGKIIRQIRDLDEDANLYEIFNGGRDIPEELLQYPDFNYKRIIEYLMTWIYTGARTSTDYIYFGHLYDLGAILNFLSDKLDIATTYKGEMFSLSYQAGEQGISDLQPIKTDSKSGTTLKFKLALSLFGETDIDSVKMDFGIKNLAQKYQNVQVSFSEAKT